MFDAAAAESDNCLAVAQQFAATLAHVVDRTRGAAPGTRGQGVGYRTGEPLGARGFRGRHRLGRRRRPDAARTARRRALRRGAHAARRPDRRASQRGRPRRRGWRIAATARSSRCSTGWSEVSGGAMSAAAMWHVVGTAVVSAATQVPLLAGSSELTSMRRGQAVLDALVGFGAPVRGGRRASRERPCEIRAALPTIASSATSRIHRTTGPPRNPEGCRDPRSIRGQAPHTFHVRGRPFFRGVFCRGARCV